MMSHNLTLILKIQILIIINIVFVSITRAQVSYTPMNTDAVLDNMEVLSYSLTGSTTAQSSVVNGASGYSIPIAMPAGTSGIVPELALNYTSNARSSVLGYGWGLSGISVISRIGQSNYYDGNTTPINFNETDRYILDGNRMLIESGNYGAPGSVYSFEAENFSRITAFGGTTGNPQYFVLETKDGIKYEYGNGYYSQHIIGGNDVKDWYLSKMIYPDGNYITYKYKQNHTFPGAQINQQVIDEIYFTANDAAGIANYAGVKFVYDVRTDKNSAFISSVRLDQWLLLTEVKVIVDNSDFRSYVLKYSERNGNSFLNEVSERSGVCTLTSTKFKYGDEPTGYKMQHTVNPIHTMDSYFPSNLNADGITDILRARRNSSSPMYHDYFNGTSDQLFTRNLPTTSTVVGSSDCNGDQMDDVAVMSVINREIVLGVDPEGNTIYQFYDLHRFKVYHNGDLSSTLDYNQIYELPLMNDSILYHNTHLSNTFGGDFNGDGLGDYLFLNGSQLYISYGQRSVTQPLLPWMNITATAGNFTPLNTWTSQVERLYVIDFNSDGKSDIFMINGAQGAVYEFDSSNHLHEVFWDDGGGTSLQTRLFDQQFLLYPGDFNGDGKTDFLKRVGSSNSDSWALLYSTGINFTTVGFDFPRIPSIEQMDFGVYFGDVVSTGDFNGDGKSDVLLVGKIGNHSFYTDLFLSYGLNMSNTIYEEHYNIPFVNCYTGSDFPGIDGKNRTLIKLYTGHDPLELSMSPKYKDNLLVKVKNGELNTTIFDYKLMTEKLGVGDDFYVRGPISSATNLISNVQMPAWLAKDFKVQNGSGAHNNYSDFNMKVQSMTYANAKLQRTGKGVIGFAKQCMEDKWSYLRTLTYNSANTQYAIMLPDSVVTEFVTGADFTKSHTQHIISGVGTSNRYLMTADKMTLYNYHENRVTEQDFQQYDAYANPTLVSTQISTGTPGTVLETQTTTTTYGTYGGPVPNKPTNITTSLSRNGNPSYTSTSVLDYNAIGQVTMKKEFATQTKETTTTYIYWPHGGIKQTSIAATGMPAQTFYTDYDVRGRFITQKRNHNNEIVYNAVYGNNIIPRPTQETDEAGLTTTTTYDCFGRISTVAHPSGVSTVHIYTWDGATGDKKETILTSNRPTSTMYYDRLGRMKRSEVTGFNGETITQTSSYNLIGKPYQHTAPYKAGEAILTTTNTYGIAYTAQRIASTTTDVAAFGNTQYTYTYDQGYETITTTAPDGKVSSSKVDAAGKTIQTTDSNGTVLDLSYYSHGGLREVKQGSTVLVSVEYDEYNRKKKQTDISAGITQYEYDAYGRMKSEINAKGQTTTMLYDNLSRLMTLTRPEGTTSYEYWPAGVVGKAFKVKKVTGHAGDIHEMDYDAVGRLVSDKVTIDGQSYTTTTQYDAMDRISSRIFPSGLTLHYEYDSYSYLKRIYSGSTTYVTIDEVNGRGQVTKYTLGNGKQSVYDYFHGIPVKYATTDGSYEYNMLWDYKNGNLKKRWDQYGNKDTMAYDNLDRLVRWTTQSSDMSIRHDTVHYADNGNILKKTDVGSYTYDPVRIYATTEITNPHGLIKDAQQYITYNSFLQPDTIREGAYTLIYTYGYDGNRIKSVLKYNNVVKETKYYLGDYEKVISDQGTAIIHYIAIDGQLKVIIDTQGSTHTPHYVYTDHLGSIIKVTNAAGTDEVVQTFDPWGRRRDYSTWTYIDENLPLGHPIWLYRGYTGHEHLPQFHLINMNGRMYDPEVGRMLSPDNYIQDGGYSQNYNRYSYGYNNPMKYTDPDGNFIVPLLFVVGTGLLSNGMNNLMSGKPFFEGAAQTLMISVVSFGFASGIGSATAAISSSFLKAGVQAVAHGVVGGVMAMAQGGKFIHGFVSTALGSVATSVTMSLTEGTLPRILSGGVTSGLIAELQGGNFYDGFRQGIIVAAFNHLQHEGNGAEDVVAEAEASSDGGGDPPKVGDVCIDECGVAQVFNGDGWEVWKFKVTGTGQITPTDSPLEWLLGGSLRLVKFGVSATKNVSSEIKLFSSLTEKFGDGYKSVSVARGAYLDVKYGSNLNAASKGVWQKVYEAGYLNGSKVEVHYFYNSTTGQYANPFILTGKWASKAFNGLK